MAYTIKELESLSGIKAHTIRIWEQRYRFLKPSRTQTNIRMYNNEELKVLLTVALLNKYGYKISRIDEMPAEQRASAALELQQPQAYNENMVNQMIGCMIDLDSTGFEDLLNSYLTKFSIDDLISGIIFPFLERVGILWQTSRIIPVQEHIVSNIIRQKLVSAIDRQPFATGSGPLYLLFLPEDEHHELGLLYVYYSLRKTGTRVIYLGANVPLKDMEYIIGVKNPDVLYVHLTSFPRQHSFQKFLNTIGPAAGKAPVLISGAVARNPRPAPENIVFLKSFAEVKSYITQEKG